MDTLLSEGFSASLCLAQIEEHSLVFFKTARSPADLSAALRPHVGSAGA